MRLVILMILGVSTLWLGCDDGGDSNGEGGDGIPDDPEDIDDAFFEEGDCEGSLVGTWSVVDYTIGGDVFDVGDDPACADTTTEIKDMEVDGTVIYESDGTWTSVMNSLDGTMVMTISGTCLETLSEGALDAETACGLVSAEGDATCEFASDTCTCEGPFSAEDMPITASGTYTHEGTVLTMIYDENDTDPDLIQDPDVFDVCVMGDEAILRDEDGFVIRIEK